MPNQKGNSVLSPNLGLYLGQPSLSISPRALSAGLNFRIQEGKLNNLNLGWGRFSTFVLNGPVLLINNFFPITQGLPEQLIFGTVTDLYRYRSGTDDVRFLTPIYATGTASASGTAVTGSGTTWTDIALNIKLGDQISFGSNAQTDPAATWFTISAPPGSDTSIVLSGSAGTVVDGPYTIRRLFSGGDTTVWSSDVFQDSVSGEDKWIVTNGVDPIVIWNGSDASVTDPGLAFRAKVIKVYNNMVIALNLLDGGDFKPTDMINSAPGDPLNFSTGLASQFKIHAGTDEIVGAEVLGDNLVIYSAEHLVQAQFTGDDLVFIFRQAGTTIGPSALNAVANYGDYHSFLGRDSQYAFDGVTIKETNTHVWREILRTQDPARKSRTYHHFDQENGELLWVIGLTTDPNPSSLTSPPAQAWTEHYLEDVGNIPYRPYSTRQFPFTSTGYYTKSSGITWNSLTTAWQDLNFRWNDRSLFSEFPLNLAGTVDGKVFTFNTSQNADGAALPSYVRSGRRPTMDGVGRGLVSRVYPFVTSFTNPLNVTVRMSDHAVGSPTIVQTDSFDQTLPPENHFTNPYRRGRFVEIEFGTTGPNQPWQLDGYSVDVKMGGGR